MLSTLWQPLQDELNLWQDAGMTPEFWWRDDDASRPGPQLQRMAGISKDLPVCLAVVPDWLEPDLAPWIDKNYKNAVILQHGWAHKSHAFAGQKKCEFGENRPLDDSLDDIMRGHTKLKNTFGTRYQSVFVPPWNRVSDQVVNKLSSENHIALSVYGARADKGRGFPCLNTHVDIINWRGGKSFVGTQAAVNLCVRHLTAKRTGFESTDPSEPTGILTHHRDHDAGCWEFLEDIVSFIEFNQHVKWVTPIEALT